MKTWASNLRQPWGVAAAVLTLLIGSAGGAAQAQTQAPEQAPESAVAPQATEPQPLDVDSPVSDPMAAEVPGVTIQEHLGEIAPLDLPFVDEAGERVTLRDYTSGDKPILLTLNYYRCPMLCGLVLNGMTDALKQVKLDPGKDYRIVTLSIDPAETASLARMKQEAYLKYAPEPFTDNNGNRIASTLTADEVRDGWAFLTGEKQNIEALAQAVGFGYKWMESEKQYAHPAVLILLSPDGKITRYLYGVAFDPDTVELSLVEASDGKIGSALHRFLLTCYHFDPNAGEYTLQAMFVMRAGGAAVALLLAGTIGVLLLREYRRRSDPRPVTEVQ